jgi:hypothetical protein
VHDILHAPDRLGAGAGRIRLRLDRLDVGQHEAPKLGEMRLVAFAMKEAPAQFGLERLDGARQSGLGDIAALGGAREIQLARQSQKIADLLHFHGSHPP